MTQKFTAITALLTIIITSLITIRAQVPCYGDHCFCPPGFIRNTPGEVITEDTECVVDTAYVATHGCTIDMMIPCLDASVPGDGVTFPGRQEGFFNEYGFMDLSLLYDGSVDCRSVNIMFLSFCLKPITDACGAYDIDLYRGQAEGHGLWKAENVVSSSSLLREYMNSVCASECASLQQERSQLYGVCLHEVEQLHEDDTCDSSIALVECMSTIADTTTCGVIGEELSIISQHIQYIPRMGGVLLDWQLCGIHESFIPDLDDIQPVNECLSSPCSQLARCIDYPVGYLCACYQHYIGDGEVCAAERVNNEVLELPCRHEIQFTGAYITYSSHSLYPENYYVNMTCVYVITFATPSLTYVAIDFIDFYLEEPEDDECVYDYLDVFDDDVMVGRFCGYNTITSYRTTSEHDVTMILYTDHSVEHTGFRFTVTAVDPALWRAVGEDEFLCSSAVVIASIYTCDGQPHCLDHLDEEGCIVEQFYCNSGEVLSTFVQCDGIRHCTDASDELNCPGYFFCGESENPIIADYWCDGVVDCVVSRLDESYESGCLEDPCASYPCFNGGACVSDGEQYNCSCVGDWGGERCTVDVVDNCANSSICENSGLCYDGVGRAYCVCDRSYAGQNCEIDTDLYFEELAYVSHRGEDHHDCGSQNQPCRTLEYMTARTRTASYINIDGSIQARDVNSVENSKPSELQPRYNLTESFWLNRSMYYQPYNTANNTQVALYLDFIVTKTSEDIREIHVRFSNLTLSGFLYVGDALVEFRSCVLKDLYVVQEFQRRDVVKLISISMKSVTMQNSDILTATPLQTESVQLCEMVRITATNTSMVNPYLSIHARQVEIRFTHCNVSGNGDLESNKPVGFYIDTYRREPDEGGNSTRQGTSTTPSPAVLQSDIVLSNVKMLDLVNRPFLGQAALAITAEGIMSVLVEKSTFSYNNRAIMFHLLDHYASFLSVYSSSFTGNGAGGPGGAVLIDQTYGQVSVTFQNCTFINNTAYNLNDTGTVATHNGEGIEEEEVDFSIVAGNGGAIAVNSNPPFTACSLKITSCSFVENNSDNYGGTLYIDSSITGEMISNTFRNTNASSSAVRPILGDMIESRGRMRMIDNFIDVISANGSVPIVSYRATEQEAFLESNNLVFTCPEGFVTETVSTTVALSDQRTQIETLLLYCYPCGLNTYKLNVSQILVNESDVLHTTDDRCRSCPYGANCDDIIVKSKANFWGEAIDNHVDMYLCPEGYCCEHPTCQSYYVCAEHRTGLLCGRCDEGYSESMFTTECVSNNSCSYESIFWVVIIIYGILYVIFFILEEEWQYIVSHFTIWIKVVLSSCCTDNITRKEITALVREKSKRQKMSVRVRRPSSVRSKSSAASSATPEEEEEEEEELDDTAGAYVSIFMYFIQVPNILKVTIFYGDDREFPLKQTRETIKSIFSFNTLGLYFNTCLFKDVDALFKLQLQLGFIVYLFVILALLYLMLKPFSCLLSAIRKGKPMCQHAGTFDAKFVGGLVSLLLYTYQYFAENSFMTLRCVSLNSQQDPVLYMQADYVCYGVWQYFVILFVCIYVVPFTIVLAISPDILRRRVISVKIFILSLFLPLFTAPYLILRFVQERMRQAALKTASRGQYNNSVSQSSNRIRDSRDLVSRLLTDPYKNAELYGVCWEGVVALKRLVLIIMANFIKSLIIRHTFLALGCLAALVLHLSVRPYAKKSCNVLETVSLSVLVFISMMNLLKAGYFQSGEIPETTADRLFMVYDWIEAVFLSVIPTAVLGLVFLAICIRLVVWPFQICYRNRKKNPIRNSLRRRWAQKDDSRKNKRNEQLETIEENHEDYYNDAHGMKDVYSVDL